MTQIVIFLYPIGSYGLSMNWNRKTHLKLAACAALVTISTSAALAESPVGDWLVENGSARIRIVDCASVLWGLMAAEKTPSTDDNNPDPKLRGRPMVGVPMLLDLKQSEPNLWTGKIYDPVGSSFRSGGKYYGVKVSFGTQGKLEVRGCVGSVFCGGQDWTRVTDPNTQPVPPAGSIFTLNATSNSKSPKAATKGTVQQSAPDPVCASVANVTIPR
jgi:uncharacterized protein (DUF2147 family)